MTNEFRTSVLDASPCGRASSESTPSPSRIRISALGTDPPLFLIAIVGLLVLSALFSGSETALTASNQARIHHLLRKGNKRARTVTRLMETREHLIGAILLGNIW